MYADEWRTRLNLVSRRILDRNGSGLAGRIEVVQQQKQLMPGITINKNIYAFGSQPSFFGQFSD